jgi:hypothetical protein
MESAGVALVKGDLRGIVRWRRLCRATMRNIRQNLCFAFIYNLTVLRQGPLPDPDSEREREWRGGRARDYD